MTKKRKTVLLVLTACVLFGLLYAITYIPRKLITIEPESVSRIEIFDGTRGELLTVTAAEELNHIIGNLNRVTFQKGKCSFGYMGYRYRLTIYNQKGTERQSLIINSSDLIRYRSFFYTDKENSIDIDYISSLFDRD